jgi:hypothetical protein
MNTKQANIKSRFFNLPILFFCTILICTSGHAKCNEIQKNKFKRAVDDYELSPYTGYTRQHWLEITEQIIAGVLPYLNKETGMPQLDKNRYDYWNLKFKDSSEEK